MAYLIVGESDVVVRLKPLEGLASWRRELRLPIASLRMVHVEQSPLANVSLWRLPGLSWPGAFALGIRRQGGRREFAAVRRTVPAVVLDAEGGRWDRVVVSHPDAVKLAAEIAQLLLIRGPPHHTGPPRHSPSSTRGLTLERNRSFQLRREPTGCRDARSRLRLGRAWCGPPAAPWTA